MNILIVDDHDGMRSMIKDLVSTAAATPTAQIRECASGEEALEVCDSFVPDCITMDLRMGGMTGIECIRRIRQRHSAAHIAVVSNFDLEIMRTRASQAGADAYFSKDDLEPLRRYLRLLATQLG